MMSENEHNIDSASLVQIDSTRANSAVIRVDLTAYVNAFTLARDNPGNVSYTASYDEYFLLLRRMTTTFSGDCLFTNMIKMATQMFEYSEQKAIKISPAYVLARESFIEILKNVLDESIDKYYSTPELTTCVAMLELNIHDSNPNTIKMIFKDNGRGFQQDFLNKMSDPVARREYMLSKGSPKQLISRNDRPHLFGGAGRGTRNFVARADTWCDLDTVGHLKPHYIMPNVSILTFGNDQHGGAVITIETSREPLQHVVLEAPLTMTLTLPRFSFLSNKINALNQFKATELDENRVPEDESVRTKMF